MEAAAISRLGSAPVGRPRTAPAVRSMCWRVLLVLGAVGCCMAAV
jgi:hypothetical protein